MCEIGILLRGVGARGPIQRVFCRIRRLVLVFEVEGLSVME